MVGAIVAATVGVSAFAVPFLVIVWLRRRRAPRRPSAAMLDAERAIRGLVHYRSGVARVPADFRVWPDMECVNDLCPYHYPCTTARRSLCFNEDCPLDGHPMREPMPS